MHALDLHTSDPTQLVDRSTPQALLEAILNLEAWDEKSLETANLLITVWASNAIARPNDRESISELQRIIHYAINRSNSIASLPEEHRYRWVEASDLLEARRLNLAHADPEAQLKRRHVDNILAFLSDSDDEEFLQTELISHLGVTAGRVSQLVGPLESNGLLTKRKTGRDVVLRLTKRGKQLAKQLDKQNGKTRQKPSTSESSCHNDLGFSSLFWKPDLLNNRFTSQFNDLNTLQYSPSKRELAEQEQL